MRNLLLLVHRIPYPPDKGGKIRSYHLLRFLAQRHRVFLGAFVDDPHDRQHCEVVARLCAGSRLERIDPRVRKFASGAGLLTGQALSLPYYRHSAMQHWVDESIAREGIDAVIAYSSTMAQYVQGERYAGLTRIADFVDVDSEKWRQYAARSSGLKAWIFRREADRLLDHERSVAAEFDSTFLVSDREADLFRSLAPESAAKISHYLNGVDTEYFDPGIRAPSPYSEGGPVVVFTGAMDYWPNCEAVSWFVADMLPVLRRARPDVRFAVVGSNPTESVCALARAPGVIVTGRVPDVRPYLRHAAVAVAPLRIARGIQNKLLEALAMARPVVCTSAAAEGLRPSPLVDAALAETPDTFASKVLANLERGSIPAHREYAIEHYGWDANLAVVEESLRRSVARAPAPPTVALESA